MDQFLRVVAVLYVSPEILAAAVLGAVGIWMVCRGARVRS